MCRLSYYLQFQASTGYVGSIPYGLEKIAIIPRRNGRVRVWKEDGYEFDSRHSFFLMVVLEASYKLRKNLNVKMCEKLEYLALLFKKF